jgi:hypothetical protein
MITSVSTPPAGYRFPREVIATAVRWYLRYGLSYRDVEELLAEQLGVAREEHGRCHSCARGANRPRRSGDSVWLNYSCMRVIACWPVIATTGSPSSSTHSPHRPPPGARGEFDGCAVHAQRRVVVGRDLLGVAVDVVPDERATEPVDRSVGHAAVYQ